jgi:hypothetical protein
MSRTAVRVGRLTALWLLAGALALAGWVSIAAASTGRERTLRPATMLWKSYPLEQRPSTTEQAWAALGSLLASRQRSPEAAPQLAPEVQSLWDTLLMSVLLAALVGIATIVLMESSVPARVGGFRRARDGAQPREPERRPSDAKPARRPRRRPPP